MLSDQVAVVILEGDFRLGGFIQSGAAETDGCICRGHFHPRCKKKHKRINTEMSSLSTRQRMGHPYKNYRFFKTFFLFFFIYYSHIDSKDMPKIMEKKTE